MQPLYWWLMLNLDMFYLFSIVMSVRNTCVDWLRGVEPHEDPAMKGKKDPEDGFFIKVPRRNVGPSTTQVFYSEALIWICK